MLQQLIFEVKEIQRSAEKKNVKTSPIVGSDGNIVNKSVFRRPMAQPDHAIISSDTKFYFDDMEEFRRQFNSFNDKDQSIDLQCVGYANIKLRFCGRCYDAKKDLPLDLYFVNRKPNKAIPQNLCLGCLGVFLKQHKDAMKNSDKELTTFGPSSIFLIESPESTL